MSSISIIGTGNMARAIGALAVAGGNTVEVIGRDQSKAAELAKALGGQRHDGRVRHRPGRRHRHRGPVVRQCRSGRRPVRRRPRGQGHRRHQQPLQLRGRRAGHPRWHLDRAEVAKAAPASASVVKAFNTLFRVVLAQGRPLDVFIAGDDARAKAGVSAFIESLGLRPLDVGGLNMAHWLEGAGLLSDGPGPPRGRELRLLPRRHRSRLSRTPPARADNEQGHRAPE